MVVIVLVLVLVLVVVVQWHLQMKPCKHFLSSTEPLFLLIPHLSTHLFVSHLITILSSSHH